MSYTIQPKYKDTDFGPSISVETEEEANTILNWLADVASCATPTTVFQRSPERIQVENFIWEYKEGE